MNCGEPHPTYAVRCDRSGINHPVHSAYVLSTDRIEDWPNKEYVKPTPKMTKEQKEGRSRKKLKEMADRTKTDRHYPSFYPTENDMRGRTALYLLKYKGEWITMDELQMKTVGGKGALRSIKELTNHFGWEIAQKMGPDDQPVKVKLVESR